MLIADSAVKKANSTGQYPFKRSLRRAANAAARNPIATTTLPIMSTLASKAGK
jgi:hypothetical protein